MAGDVTDSVLVLSNHRSKGFRGYCQVISQRDFAFQTRCPLPPSQSYDQLLLDANSGPAKCIHVEDILGVFCCCHGPINYSIILP